MDVCTAHGDIGETNTARVSALAALNCMFVQWLEDLDKRCNPWPGSRAYETLWNGADGDMNSAAGPVHPRPLPLRAEHYLNKRLS